MLWALVRTLLHTRSMTKTAKTLIALVLGGLLAACVDAPTDDPTMGGSGDTLSAHRGDKGGNGHVPDARLPPDAAPPDARTLPDAAPPDARLPPDAAPPDARLPPDAAP
jgi:hypothetical protein